jgi:hypothetical protein
MRIKSNWLMLYSRVYLKINYSLLTLSMNLVAELIFIAIRPRIQFRFDIDQDDATFPRLSGAVGAAPVERRVRRGGTQRPPAVSPHRSVDHEEKNGSHRHFFQ